MINVKLPSRNHVTRLRLLQTPANPCLGHSSHQKDGREGHVEISRVPILDIQDALERRCPMGEIYKRFTIWLNLSETLWSSPDRDRNLVPEKDRIFDNYRDPILPAEVDLVVEAITSDAKHWQETIPNGGGTWNYERDGPRKILKIEVLLEPKRREEIWRLRALGHTSIHDVCTRPGRI